MDSTSCRESIPLLSGSYATAIPVRSPDVCTREEAEDEGIYLVYHAGREAPYLMNSTAKALLELCNGQRTVAEIITSVLRDYSIPPEMNVESVISTYLLLLSRLDMISL